MTQYQSKIDPAALGQALTGLFNAPAQMAAGFANAVAGIGTSGCTIPSPCWEPRPAGTCKLTLAPGCKGTIRVHVLNCGWDRRVIGVTALGKIAAWLTFQPTTLVVGPQERATFVVTVGVADQVKPGTSLSGPLLVRGCVDHFVRLDVDVAECVDETCCDVTIDDCADNIHHWYDHFYCPRPCRDIRTQDGKYYGG
ncbi:MAG: hypothetical protein P8Z36_03445 [Gemmatimonadota bacterium]